MAAETCQRCDAPLPAQNRFCGQCGASVSGEEITQVVAAAPQPAPLAPAAPPARPGVLRRYRGPLWVGGIGSVFLIAGVGLASAIVSTVQLDAAPGILADIFGPLVEDQVDGTIVEDVIDLGSAGGSVFSTATLIGLIASGVLAVVGLLMVVFAAAWAANRSRIGRRSGVVTIAAPPLSVHYERPAFHRPAPPTYATPPAPEPLPPPAPPTFTTRPKSGPPA